MEEDRVVRNSQPTEDTATPTLGRARALGRSGPRVTTGCLTCRQRKVRCDEGKPTCANCIRLGRECHYQSRTPTTPRRAGTTSSSASQVSRAATASLNVSNISSSRPQQNRAALNGSTYMPHDPSEVSGLSRRDSSGPGLLDFPPMNVGTDNISSGVTDVVPDRGPFASSQSASQIPAAWDAGAVNGDIFPYLNFNDDLHDFFSSLNSPLNQETHERASLQPDQNTGSEVSGTSPGSGGFGPSDVTDPDRAAYESRLTQHFLSVVSPPAIIVSVDTEWKFVRDTISSMAKQSPPLMNAIYAFSDVHLSKLENRWPERAPLYYELASNQAEGALRTPELSDKVLKQLFAAIFFLIYVELLAPPQYSARYTAHFHLRSAHVLLEKFQERVSTWRGVGRRILSWIQLLDVKATFAGREGTLLEKNGGIPRPDELDTHDPDDDNDPQVAPSALMWNAINQPAFVFFMRTQQFSRRIARIDRWHRERGTLKDEYEVLQIAHKIQADLEELWNDRPAVLDVYDKAEDLQDVLIERVAKQICRSFRQYIANYEAHFIYLFRVAFHTYPRTERVNQAMEKILSLARIDAADGPLPLSLLWPIFMVGVEANLEERAWVMDEMRRMAGTNALEQPNSGRTLRLLEEVTRRQDEGNTRVDSRAVRRELFAVDFDMM